MKDVTAMQAITLAIAVLGAVLGVINTWIGLDKSRVKLRVAPAHAIPVGDADPRLRFSLTITILSAFVVTIKEAGIFYSRSTKRGSLTQPVLADGRAWPRRLEPRSSVTLYSQRPAAVNGRRIRTAYARTACGVTKTGSSPALRQIAVGDANF
jgi:hypothetical protein